MKKMISSALEYIVVFIAYLSYLCFGHRKTEVGVVAAPPAEVYDFQSGKPLNGTDYAKANRMFDSPYYVKGTDPRVKPQPFYIMTINRVPMTGTDGKKTMKDVVYLHNEEHDIEVNLPKDNLLNYFYTKD